MSCSAAGHTQHLGPASGHVEGPGSKVTAAALLVRDASQAQPSADGCGALLEEPSSGLVPKLISKTYKVGMLHVD